jgi:hypothetical protein
LNTRRKLVIALGAAALGAPLIALAQQPRAIPMVGVLSLEIADQIALLREGLAKLGYVEGRNIHFEMGKPDDRYAQLAEIAE